MDSYSRWQASAASGSEPRVCVCHSGKGAGDLDAGVDGPPDIERAVQQGDRVGPARVGGGQVAGGAKRLGEAVTFARQRLDRRPFVVVFCQFFFVARMVGSPSCRARTCACDHNARARHAHLIDLE